MSGFPELLQTSSDSYGRFASPQSDRLNPFTPATLVDMPRVLIVEDDVTLRTVVTLQLAKLGVQADAAANGVEALKLVRENRYQLIIMDLHMPEMDGFQAFSAIREYENQAGLQPVPIVALSGGGHRERALEMGFDAYFEKPALRSDLSTMLQKWLDSNDAP